MQNKEKKGISLLVLIITIIVMVILASTVMIVITNNNPLSGANEAKFKSDIRNISEKAQMSVIMESITNPGIMDEVIQGEEIYQYVPELKNSRYKGFIVNGNFALDQNSYTETELKWASEIGVQIGITPQTDDIILTATKTSITVEVIKEDISKVTKYMYKIIGPGIVEEWKESLEKSYEFTGLKLNTEYTIEVKIEEEGKESDIISKKIRTQGEFGQVQIAINPSTWTKTVTVTLNYATPPEGYTIEYKEGNGNWKKYTSPFAVTQNQTIAARLYNTTLNDEVGGSSKTITNIDAQAPTVPTEIATISKTENSIRVKANGSTDMQSGIAGYQYSTNETTWSEITTGNYTINGLKSNTSITVYAKAVDRVGNESGTKQVIIKTNEIKVNLIYTLEPNKAEGEYLNGNVSVDIATTGIPRGYVLQYKIGEGNWTNYQQRFYVEMNTTIRSRIINSSVGEEIELASKQISYIDKIPPTAPTKIEVVSRTENSLVVKASGATDSISGVAGYQYSIDGTNWSGTIAPNTGYTISGLKSNTNVTIYAKAIDKVNLVSTVMTVTEKTNTISNVVTYVLSPNPAAGTYINGDIQVTMTATLPSGYQLQYKLTGQSSYQNYTGAITITENTTIETRIYHASLKDEIIGTSKQISCIDKTAPTVPTAIEIAGTTVNTITVKASGSTDSISGVAGYQYSTNGTNWSATTTENYTISGIKANTEVTIYARAIDKVGIVSGNKMVKATTGAVTIAVTINGVPTTWTNQNVSVTLTHPSIPSGYVLQYKLGSGAWTDYTAAVVVSSNMTVYARLYNKTLSDEAGATSKEVTKIDKTVPVMNSVAASTTVWINGNVTITGKATDAQSGIVGYQFSTNASLTAASTGWTAVTATTAQVTHTYTATANGTYYYYVKDVAGNINKKEIAVTNIDKTAPTVPTAIEVTGTTVNTITVKASGSTDAGSGIAGYQYSTNGTSRSATVASGTAYTISGIKAGTEVTVYARAVDKVGIVSGNKTVKATTGAVTTAVTINGVPTAWTNQNASITLVHADIPSGYVLQYKLGSGGWTNYTAAVSVTSNMTVYARLYNSALADEIAATSKDVTKIDKVVPNNATITLPTTPSSSSFTATVVQSDSLSGVNISASKYKLSTNQAAFGVTSAEWNSGASTFTSTNQTISLTANEGTYYLHVLTVDNVGNKKETVSSNSVKVPYPTPSGGSVYTDSAGVKVPVPAGYTVSTVAGENTVFQGLVIKEGSNGAASSYNVNEFVWIPVDDITEMYDEATQRGKLYNFSSGRLSTLISDCLTTTTGDREPDVSAPDGGEYDTVGITKEGLQNEFNAMIASVKKYKGFYIGRYETGDISQNTPVVRKLNIDLSNQNWYNMYTRTRNIVSNASGQTTIIWGCQWDAALRWMNKDSSIGDYVTNSTGKGNYYDQTFTYITNTSGATATKALNSFVIIPTGSYEGAKVKNIYDMAGNVWDLTMASYYGSRTGCGGAYAYGAASYPASSENVNGAQASSDDVGVRVQLYLK